MKWCIYYDNGERFSNLDGAWLQAPFRGVIALSVYVPGVGQEIEHGHDYYIWWPGALHPWGVGKEGLWDFLAEIDSPLSRERIENEHFFKLGELGVKIGRTTSTFAYNEIMEVVESDSQAMHALEDQADPE